MPASQHFCRRHFLRTALLSAGALSLSQTMAAEEPAWGNALLKALKELPRGGGYDGSPATTRLMARATGAHETGLQLRLHLAQPSYCSGATYLAFLQLLQQHQLVKSERLARTLLLRDVPDGTGVWGRWNANGPGLARLFHQCRLGRNFESWRDATPGDFLKIFWNDHIGARERGHLVILQDPGRGRDPKVRFWSSNQPGGYGTKSVRRSKIRWAIFSRLEQPQNIRLATQLPARDPWLARMLSDDFSRDEVRKKCGILPGLG